MGSAAGLDGISGDDFVTDGRGGLHSWRMTSRFVPMWALALGLFGCSDAEPGAKAEASACFLGGEGEPAGC